MGIHEEMQFVRDRKLKRKDGKKYFRDPIRGYIEVSVPELDIVNHPLFQRLRRIKQLGLAYYVFHGAEHTRFGHSLGTMDIANSILNVIPEINEDVCKKISLAALLHDIGHPPLSHALETCIRDILGVEGHEEYTKAIIENTSIRDILTKHGFSNNDIEDIVGFILGHHIRFPLGAQIIHSELDADRLDYLLRDSIFCGVKYGIYDLDRLLISLRPHESKLVVSQKGIYAAEGFILARYHMYVQVYIHKTKCGFEVMAREIFKELVEKNLIEYPLPSSGNLEEELLDKDDIWFFSELRRVYKSQESSERLKKLIKMLLYRKPLKMVEEARAYYSVGERSVSEKFALLQHLKELKPVLQDFEKNEIEENEVFVDRPSVELKQKPYYLRATAEEKEEALPIFVMNRDGKPIDIAEIRDSPIRDIAAKRLEIVRVYTFKEKEKDVRNIIEKRITNR